MKNCHGTPRAPIVGVDIEDCVFVNISFLFLSSTSESLTTSVCPRRARGGAGKRYRQFGLHSVKQKDSDGETLQTGLKRGGHVVTALHRASSSSKKPAGSELFYLMHSTRPRVVIHQVKRDIFQLIHRNTDRQSTWMDTGSSKDFRE